MRSSVSSVSDELKLAFNLHKMPWPEDPAIQHAMLDRPFMFGDCPMDCLQGALNLARNAEDIVSAPLLPKVTCPVIAVGSGPSLAFHVDRLKQLQDRCIIVAALSAVRGLRAAGIEPHFTTPIERTEDVIDYVPDCGEIAFAGAPIVARSVCRAFRRHYYVPNRDGLSLWSSLPDDPSIYFGSSTGTLAVSLATHITTGPVYLVGHDLAYEAGRSHWENAQNAPVVIEGKIMGNNGKLLDTTWLWLRFVASLAEFAKSHGNVINTNISDKRGAKIDGALPGDLPEAGDWPIVGLPYGKRNPERLNRFKGLLRRLPHQVRHAIKTFAEAKTLDDLDIARAVPGPSGMMLAYVVGSVYVQQSYELSIGLINQAQAFDWTKTALLNVLGESRGVIDEMASYG